MSGARVGGPHVTGTMREMLEGFRRRRAVEPVARDEATGRWQVFRHADATTVMTDPSLFSSDLSEFIPDHEELLTFSKGNFQAMDDPRHRELRSLVSQGFTPRFVQGLAPRVEQVAGELLDARRDGGRVDLVADLAHPLPVTVIAEVMGLPLGDRHLFRRWAYALLVDNGVDALFSEQGVAAMAPAIREMNLYLLDHVRERRQSGEPGLIDDLVHAESDGRRLDDQEIVGFLALLLIAGFLTTSTLLTNAVLCLDENPHVVDRLRADPGLIDPTIEEVLRYRSPLVWLDRRAVRDVEFGGCTIPAGSPVAACLVSAGRDESVFDDPDTFDIDRPRIRHLAFGMGAHFCLGAPLARLEVRTALRAMLERFTDFRVADDEPVLFHDPKDFNGAVVLPVDLKPV